MTSSQNECLVCPDLDILWGRDFQTEVKQHVPHEMWFPSASVVSVGYHVSGQWIGNAISRVYYFFLSLVSFSLILPDFVQNTIRSRIIT